jgi:two-component system response regulator HydG
VDVRIIAATNRDLPEAIAGQQFREDLYYRLRVLEMRLPPLRERGEDVRILANHFLHQFARRDGRTLPGLSSEALAVLEGYHWPGNVRELENAIEHAVALAEEDGELLGPELLPEHVLRGSERIPVPLLQSAPSAEGPPDTPGAGDVVEALSATGWDLSQAAEKLGVPLSAVAYAVRRHNLVADLGSEV